MAGYKKPRVICPYCEIAGTKNADGTPRHFTVNGMTAHVRSMHSGDFKDWQANKDKYVASHGCDDNGVLIKGGSPKEGSFPEPEPPGKPKPEPEPDDEEYEYIIEEIDDEDDPDPDPGSKRKQRKPEPEPDPKPKPEPDGDPFWDCALS